jgi:glutathione S-transferase
LIHHWGAHIFTTWYKAAFTADPEEAAKYRPALVEELRKVNTILLQAHRKEGEEDGKFFLGGKFTFADLAIAPFLARFFLMAEYNGNELITLESNPELKRFFEWKDQVLKRSSVQMATPTYEVMLETYSKWVK